MNIITLIMLAFASQAYAGSPPPIIQTVPEWIETCRINECFALTACFINSGKENRRACQIVSFPPIKETFPPSGIPVYPYIYMTNEHCKTHNNNRIYHSENYYDAQWWQYHCWKISWVGVSWKVEMSD